MTKRYAEFSKPLFTLGNQYDLSRIFNDLLTLGICSFHKTNIQSHLQEKDEDNEALYLATIKPYKPEILKSFAAAIGCLQLNALDDPYSDILGEFFMEHITKGQNGQYFSPTHICDLNAKITVSKTDIGKRILDPACGSGRMCLSAAKVNHKNYFYGADNSNTCAKMATLNFFLNGLQGEVVWMNSLSMEWYGGWQINQRGLGIEPIKKEQSRIWSKAPQQMPKHQEAVHRPRTKTPHTADQLTLF